MRYFLDCEFIEDGRTIDLVSIGIVAEDGREYYACNDECDLSRANDWVKANVLPCLPWKHIGVNPGNPDVPPIVRQEILTWKTREAIATDIAQFVGDDSSPEFWGEWCSYDWVALCQLFGTMMDLPKGFPMRCRDVIQWAEDHLGIPSDRLPPSMETDGSHNALLGARTVKARFDFLFGVDKGRNRLTDLLDQMVEEPIEISLYPSIDTGYTLKIVKKNNIRTSSSGDSPCTYRHDVHPSGLAEALLECAIELGFKPSLQDSRSA